MPGEVWHKFLNLVLLLKSVLVTFEGNFVYKSVWSCMSENPENLRWITVRYCADY